MGGNLGPTKTWKITYYPKILNGGIRGVAFVEADTKHWAMYTFQQCYMLGSIILSTSVKNYLDNDTYYYRLLT